MTERRWTASGVRQQLPAAVSNGARLEGLYRRAIKARRHLFVMTAGWTIDPVRVLQPEDINLDAETLVLLAGPGCYVCEQEYSPGMEGQDCPGEPGRAALEE